MAFGTQKESSSIFNKYNNSEKQQQQDSNKNNLSNLSLSSFFYQINNHIHSFVTQFYWKENLDSPHCKEGSKRYNTHITCRGNIISNQQQQQQQQQPSTASPKSQSIKNSPNNNTPLKNNNNKNNKKSTMNSVNYNNNKLFKKSLTSSSDSSSDEYSESEETEEEEENSDKGDLNSKSTKYLSNKQKSIHEQEDLADDDSSDVDSNQEEEEDYSLTSEEEEILSDDESTDKSSSESEEEEEESESESEEEEEEEESGNDSSSSVTDESDEELQNREWSNVNSNLSLKKSVSSILFKFTDCDSTSDSDEEMDSSSGQEGSFSDKDIDYTAFDDSFLQVPTSYSINISPRKSSEQLKQHQSSDFEEVDGGYLGQKPLISKRNENKLDNGYVVSSDDELNNNRYYDDSEEELNREMIKREQENDKKVLVAIRKSINGINSGDNENNVEKPCWYGFEDESHIKVIFQFYSSFLQIDQEVKHTLRGPKPFIGRVHRRAIKYDGGEVGCKFTTLDTVKVYRWEIQPIGRPLNLYKSFVLLTRWDEENGLPVKFQKVNSLSNKDFWAKEAKSLKSQSKISSYLYCSPMFDTDFTFNYSIDAEKYPVDFLPNSPMLSSRRHHHCNGDGGFDQQQQQFQQQQQNHHSPKQYLQPLTSLNRNNKLSDSQLLPSIKTPTLSVGSIVPQRRSSHPSLLLSSHIYSHSITFGFKDKCNNDLS
ncbi:hypothetical protein ACTFIV_002437 [Dictyostelium citrinum]